MARSRRVVRGAGFRGGGAAGVEVTGTPTIASGATLTLPAGTVVKFYVNQAFNVDGVLTLRG